MKEELFDIILRNIIKGGCPPTVGYRITDDQFESIKEIIESNISKTESKKRAERYREYLKDWELKKQK